MVRSGFFGWNLSFGSPGSDAAIEAVGAVEVLVTEGVE